jgi:hypothetical protein
MAGAAPQRVNVPSGDREMKNMIGHDRCPVLVVPPGAVLP